MKIEISSPEHKLLLEALEQSAKTSKRQANSTNNAAIAAIHEQQEQFYKALQAKIASQELPK